MSAQKELPYALGSWRCGATTRGQSSSNSCSRIDWLLNSRSQRVVSALDYTLVLISSNHGSSSAFLQIILQSLSVQLWYSLMRRSIIEGKLVLRTTSPPPTARWQMSSAELPPHLLAEFLVRCWPKLWGLVTQISFLRPLDSYRIQQILLVFLEQGWWHLTSLYLPY